MLKKFQYFHKICSSFQRFYSITSLEFVPKHAPVLETDFQLIKTFIQDHNKILIVTGAGISTESGIPDYRSEEVGLYARSNHKPVQYIAFLNSPSIRKCYWARNFIGWPRFSHRQPNPIHYAIQKLEKNKKLTSVVTQNVDNLHSKAGSKDVVELHGTSYQVKCLGCSHTIARNDFQKILANMNPNLCDKQQQTTMIRPDGDVEIPEVVINNFQVPSCQDCNGIYKPDIVFFGDNVPKQRMELIKRKVTESDAILVLGSSLTVFSSYRIILQASDSKLPIAIVNIGPTRADHLAKLKISNKCGDILPRLCESLNNNLRHRN